MKAERLINQKGKKRWKVGFHFGHQSFGKQYLNPGSGGPAWSHNNGFHNRPECELLSFNLSLHDGIEHIFLSILDIDENEDLE